MIIDADLVLSDAQAITSTNATASTNVVNLGTTGRNIRNDAKLVCVVNTTFDSTEEDATVTTVLETDDDEAFGSAKALWTSAAVAEATLVAGYKICEFELADFAGSLEQYIRLTYQCGTHAMTAGKVDAYIVLDKQSA